MINLFEPYVSDGARKAVLHTLNTKWIGQGQQVEKFEKDFAGKFNVTYPLTQNSGTSALETAYDLLGITKGDEVITTPMTCTATNLPLLARGCKLVWADVTKNLTIDPNDVVRKVTAKTKAIIQVHLGGINADVGKMPRPVVSDAAQALGIFNGDFTCNSFQAIKHITTGDGGMITCNTGYEYHRAKLMRWFGIDREKKIKNNWQCYSKRKMTFDIEMIGYKRQMTDIAASMGIEGLNSYDYIMEHRKRIFNLYKELLKGIDGIKLIDGKDNKHWLVTVLVEDRDNFAKAMFNAGIDTNLVHIRNDLYKIFGGKRQDLPVLNRLESKYICLPIHMNVREDDVRYICGVIKTKGW